MYVRVSAVNIAVINMPIKHPVRYRRFVSETPVSHPPWRIQEPATFVVEIYDIRSVGISENKLFVLGIQICTREIDCKSREDNCCSFQFDALGVRRPGIKYLRATLKIFSEVRGTQLHVLIVVKKDVDVRAYSPTK